MSRSVLAISIVVSIASFGLCCVSSRASDTLFLWRSGSDQGEDENKSPFDEPLESDRPGLGDSPSTVGLGVCQLELGYDYVYDHNRTSSQIEQTYPQPLLRIGAFADWFELRVSWSEEQTTDTVFGVSRSTAVGSDDMNVGFKIALTPQDKWLPKTGFVFDMFLPTGSDAFTAGKVLPEVEYIYEWEVAKKFTIDGLTILSCEVDDVTNESFLNTSEAIGVTEKLSDHLSFYVQWHMTTPDGAHSFRTQQVFEGGFIVPVTNNLQLDAESGVGLNEATPDYFVGAGLSVRR
jgi:hypothetical protein